VARREEVDRHAGERPSSRPASLLHDRTNQLFLLWVAAATAWSAVKPADYATWFFELFLGAAGAATLVLVSPRFRFSRCVYVVAAVHYTILAAGAKYTYAEEPLFNWLKDALDLERNHFDRVGHFAQGVTPALVAREALARATALGDRSRWVLFLPVCVALAFSALYEILEWGWVVVFYPDAGPEWLGLQGDPWDAQADMLLALLGALFAIAVLGRWHRASMGRIVGAPRSRASSR
jgi:putative membrane protein